MYNYVDGTTCGITGNISNPAGYPALAQMLTVHRHALSVCASIRLSMLNHVVSDLVGLLAHMLLHLVHLHQSLSV